MTSICKILGGVRAGPRRWGELRQPEMNTCRIFEGSELVQGGGMKISWAGYELVPGGQDQLIPQKKIYPRCCHRKKDL